MAKKPAKSAAKTPAKKTSSAKPTPTGSIEKATIQALNVLQTLGIEQQLQNDIEWCLGSYRHDQNPDGLYEMAQRAIGVLQEAKARKAKGVTAKVIGDLDKAIQSR